MKLHKLKIAPEYYKAVRDFDKTFEIRKNDRDFKVGDAILLEEYNGEYVNSPKIRGLISYVTDYEQKENFVVFSFEVVGIMEEVGLK